MEQKLLPTRFQRMPRLSATSLGFVVLIVGCVGYAYTEFAKPNSSTNSGNALVQFVAVVPASTNWELAKGVAFFDEWLQLAAQVSQRKDQPLANVSTSPEAEPFRKSRRELRREAQREAREKERESRNALSSERQRGVVFVCIDERCRMKRVVRAPTDEDRDTKSRSYTPEESPQRRLFAPFQRF